MAGRTARGMRANPIAPSTELRLGDARQSYRPARGRGRHELRRAHNREGSGPSSPKTLVYRITQPTGPVIVPRLRRRASSAARSEARARLVNQHVGVGPAGDGHETGLGAARGKQRWAAGCVVPSAMTDALVRTCPARVTRPAPRNQQGTCAQPRLNRDGYDSPDGTPR